MYAALVSGLDTATPSWDLFIFIFFIIATFVYGFTLGRSRILVLIISTYISLAIMKTLPILASTQTLAVADNPLFVARITAYVGLALLIFFFLSNSGIRQGLSHEDVQGKGLQIIVFSVLHAGLLVASVLSFVPPTNTIALSGLTQNLFTSNWAFSFWLLAPLVFMMIFKVEKEE